MERTGTNDAPGHRGNFKRSRPRFAAAGALLLLSAGLMLAFSRFGDAFFPAYRVFSRTVMAAIASVTGLVPVSLWDILAIPLTIALVATLAWCAARRRSLWNWLATVCVIVSAMLLFLVGAWGLNHYAPPLAQDLGIQVGQYSADELADATGRYLEQAAGRAAQVPRDGDGRLVPQDFRELAAIAGAGYSGLARDYPVFDGSTAPVKELVIAGEPLLYSGHTGIFWPFTAESNVPLNCATAEEPFIMCHEAAHRLGIASEQEANFAAFLACSRSDDARFAYAGSYEAFVYCFNALSANYPDRARELLRQALDGDAHDEGFIQGARLVFADWNATSEHYAAYEGPAEELGTAANDAYLKAFDQESGVKSYGEVVDYLIAWHQAGN